MQTIFIFLIITYNTPIKQLQTKLVINEDLTSRTQTFNVITLEMKKGATKFNNFRPSATFNPYPNIIWSQQFLGSKHK